MGVVPNVPILPGAGNAGSLVGKAGFQGGRVGVGRAGSDPWRHSGKQRCRPLAEVSTRSMVLPAGAALSRRSGRGTGSAGTALLGYVLGQFGAQLLRHARSSG